VHVVYCSRTQLLENYLLCFLADLCVLKLDFNQAGNPLHHLYNSVVGKITTVFEVYPLQPLHVLTHHLQELVLNLERSNGETLQVAHAFDQK
jgi:hypothetical protein